MSSVLHPVSEYLFDLPGLCTAHDLESAPEEVKALHLALTSYDEDSAFTPAAFRWLASLCEGVLRQGLAYNACGNVAPEVIAHLVTGQLSGTFTVAAVADALWCSKKLALRALTHLRTQGKATASQGYADGADLDAVTFNIH